MTNCRLEELFRSGSCARAKGTFMISVASVEGNVLMGSSDLNVHLRFKCAFVIEERVVAG
ncbi:hypothetical protein HanXRQr2_Chr14g0660181 [Helianthus annuus]|uniref:Uncharacterized protein n=1 Tax=Helianthus annuus TaxID=4232 RepID=A0A9K3ECA1_HELAN|nr:hypothetical protein HanXRQr2_Chr14g0660181 [Helianthus annuus]KAJ0470210.1 hypothetical protein HanIR_Chr14g0716271 [Helianthus annuus]